MLNIVDEPREGWVTTMGKYFLGSGMGALSCLISSIIPQIVQSRKKKIRKEEKFIKYHAAEEIAVIC